MSQPFLLGVNYWPRRKAMYWWSDFDAGEVREEFSLIAELGMQVVRIFLLWDDWQPTPDSVSSACLKHLITVADIAAEYGLQLDVTFFTGHMSGPNWAPGWLRDEHGPAPSHHLRQLVSGGQVVPGAYRNPFHDAVAIGAEKLLLSTVVKALKDHPAIWMWNLGNEPDLFAWPNDAASGQAWTTAMTQHIRELDPLHDVTCGLHSGSLFEDNGLRIDQVYAAVQTAVMHSYPMYVPIAQHPLDPNWVPFTCALVSALCGKPTLMEEWGGCTAPPGAPSQTWDWIQFGKPRSQFMASEEDLAQYVEAVLPRLLDVGATGSFMWCYADYSSDLWNRPPCDEARHERFFGLVRPEGSLKPHAEVIRRFAATKPVVNPQPARVVTLDISADEYYANPEAQITRLYHDYLQRYEEV
jgi:endo-1,4-beta-mannosidase